MIQQVGQEIFHEIDIVPQAVIGKPISYFERLRIHMATAEDDLDTYQGASLILNNTTQFALRHYVGHPTDTMTVYLPREYRDVHQITAIIARIIQELHLDEGDITWQRKDNPDL